MPQYPTSPRADVLNFCNDHADPFTSHQAAIGISVAQLTKFKNATADYASKAEAQRKAQQAARDSTVVANDAFYEMKTALADCVRSIKAFAENTATPNAVYSLAGITPPAQPTPAAPPAIPTDITVNLDANTGAIVLKWKAENPAGSSGTSYIVRRKLPSESTFSFIGVSGKKTYTDNTFTAGPDSVQYTVQGQRADSSGPVSAVFTVTFGRAPSGQYAVTSVKMAA